VRWRSQRGIDEECGAFGLRRRSRRDRIRKTRGKGSQRAGEGACELYQAKQLVRSRAAADSASTALLGGEEQRDVAGRRVQRAEERDGEQRQNPVAR